MGVHPKVLGMWAGFIYLFDCACMDQLTFLGLTHMHCWFQTQRGVPLPCPLHPHPAHLPTHSLTRPTLLVFNVGEVYSDCPHALHAAPTRPCQIFTAPRPCVLPCAPSDSGPGHRVCQAPAIAPYVPPPSYPMCCHCHAPCATPVTFMASPTCPNPCRCTLQATSGLAHAPHSTCSPACPSSTHAAPTHTDT